MNRNRRIKSISLEEAALYDDITLIETNILNRLSSLRKNKKTCLCSHFIDFKVESESYVSSVNYY